jgi:hypothetical protein
MLGLFTPIINILISNYSFILNKFKPMKITIETLGLEDELYGYTKNDNKYYKSKKFNHGTVQRNKLNKDKNHNGQTCSKGKYVA